MNTATIRSRARSLRRSLARFVEFDYSKTRTFEVMFVTGKAQHADYSWDRGNRLSLSLFGPTLTIHFPTIVKHHEKWIERRGKLADSSYMEVASKAYGAYIFDGNHVVIKWGIDWDDWVRDRKKTQWSFFLPWTAWRITRELLLGREGEIWFDTDNCGGRGGPRANDYEQLRIAEKSVAKRRFMMLDAYDNTLVEATTHQSVTFRRRGTGSFAWLGFITPMKVSRSLSIWFDREVGPEKGSWKGGTRGHGIEFRRGESHESAFRRYCEEHGHGFVGEI